MPQIAQLSETFASQAFWLAVFFLATFLIVGRGMVPKVMDTVESRNTTIAGDLAAAQAARDRADAEEAAWRTRETENRAAAQALIAKAKGDAAAASEQRMAKVQERIDIELATAESDIAGARQSALLQIEDVAAEATQDIVARLASIEVTAGEAKQAVQGAMHG